MLKRIESHIHLLVIILLWFVFSFPFFFLGKTPFPSDYQVSFFSPWSAYGMAGPVKNNAQPDIIGQIYPWRHFSVEEIKKGSIPFWNPYSFSGTPHLANYQSGVLFPLNILFFLPVSFTTAWGLLVILQPLLAGIFMFYFIRSLKLSKEAALVSSFSFMFCGFIVTWMGYATLGYAILPLPLALLCIEKYLSEGKARYRLILAATFLFSFFAGHFQTSIYFAIAVFLYILYSLITNKSRRRSWILLTSAFCGVLMTMPQVIPSIEFYLNSVRSGLFQKMEAIPWSYWPTLFSPDYFGNAVTRNDWFGHYAEWNGYAGTTAILLAIIVIIKRVKLSYFFVFILITTILLAFDSPLLNLLVALKIPVLSTSSASRIIVLTSFSVAVLSAFGFDAIRHGLKKKEIVTIVIIVVVIVVFMIGSAFTLPKDKTIIALKNCVIPLLSFASVLGFVVISYVLKKKRILLIALVLVISFSAFEMFRFSSKWQSFDPAAKAYIPVGVTSFYQKQNDYDRAVGMSGGEDSVYYRVPILTGYDPLYISRYGEFMQYVAQGKNVLPERSVVTYPFKGKYSQIALDFLGTKFVMHKLSDGTFPWAFPFADYKLSKFNVVYEDKSYKVFENASPFPRAFIAGKTILVSDDKILPSMFSADLKKIAYVEKKEAIINADASGSVKILSYNPSKIILEVNANKKALVVITDNYYPGWKATVNGKRAAIYRADYTFRGIIAPAGKSVIEMYYIPESFLIGIYFFMIGLFGISINFVWKTLNFRDAKMRK